MGRTKQSYRHYRRIYRDPYVLPADAQVTIELDFKKKADQDKKKLKQFTKFGVLPPEVGLEIAMFLTPRELLALSRTSKGFRSIFLSHRVRHIWQAAINNADLPACPKNWTEPEYASLLCDSGCSYCLSMDYVQMDFVLRLRLCSDCRANCLLNGTKLEAELTEEEVVFMRYMPVWNPGCHDLYSGFWLSNRSYLRTTVEKIKSEYMALPKDSDARRVFLEAQKTATLKDFEHSKLVQQWSQSQWTKDAEANTRRIQIFRKTIELKLQEIGYKEADFTLEGVYMKQGWSKLLHQNKEMTLRIWQGSRPKLEANIFARRHDKRVSEAAEFYKLWLQEHDLVPGASVAPSMLDLLKNSDIRAMIDEEKASIVVTKQRWDEATPELMKTVSEYQKQAETKLTASLKASRSKRPRTSESKDNGKPKCKSPAPSSLNNSSAFFRCSKDRKLDSLRYPDVLFHRCGRQEDTATRATAPSPQRICGISDIKFDVDASEIARTLLDQLDLPHTTTIDEMVDYGAAFVCKCCKHDHRKTWSDIVNHFCGIALQGTTTSRALSAITQAAKRAHQASKKKWVALIDTEDASEDADTSSETAE